MFKFRKSFYIFFDFALSLAIFSLIFYLRYIVLSEFFEISSRRFSSVIFIHLLIYSFLIVIFNIAMKCYELNKIYRIKESLLPNMLVSVISIGLIGGFFFLFKIEFARFVFFLGFIIVPFVLSVCNKLLFIAFRRRKPYIAAYVGTKNGYALFNQLMDDYKSAFNVERRFIDADNAGELMPHLGDNIKDAEFIVADTDVILPTEAAVLLNDYEIAGGRIYSLLDMFVYLDQSIPAEIIRNHHFEMFSSYKLDSFYLKAVKRFGDIMISLLLLIVTMPIMLITAFLILITSRGGVFYTQKRVGYKGKEFTIYKFRSMVKNAETGKAQLSAKNDARITWIGRIIRMVRIDELPQLIN
ncbi:MAG: sugar transferase, partial [Spirochaetales bacterium]|nr:sugar transferase [Spirochaetales bacterium]